ncbi:hypothetical protein A9Q84_03570 [Halobacteriovorax marinus]|uniref:Uncharacterized protein n=1 Tax=Halobacteriovorax marinus TaxID=97084 RepID=A0A1Y5FFM6_9BACT|nr:hypothetical protein A9Q84_03570 [Halobacteriovorax marinus]
MSTSNETSTQNENLIKIDHKGFKRATKSASRSLSLKPSRSFAGIKSIRSRTALATTKVVTSNDNLADK